METKALKKQMGAAIAMVLVAAIALAASTYAWFVSNTKVSATTSSVSATSATPNLLIRAGVDTGDKAFVTGGMTADSAISTASTALYPASSNDATNWWAVNSWTNTNGTTLANGYYKPTISLVAAKSGDTTKAIQDGQYTQGTQTLNAYQVATYSVYTTTGEVELNLDPVNPISVQVATAGSTEGNGFKDALRVGIVVGDQLKVVYAPTAETGTGNDADAQTGYRTVKDASSTQAATYQTLAGNTFTGWTATTVNGGVYTKAVNSLGTIKTTGSVVKVYIWLEGTDADCLVGTADSASDASSYKVALNFVGATQNAA